MILSEVGRYDDPDYDYDGINDDGAYDDCDDEDGNDE
jgi:hypothetical protein